uniref:SUEL-type lectin domain-containing protein n=1 Tax=Takifugu rubripes TaxID=31033 RepID=A0A674NBU5_TAKRU
LLLLLLLLLLIIIITDKYIIFNLECQRFVLRKPSLSISEKGVISVQAALYGRADTDTCSEGRPSRVTTAPIYVLLRCDGKKECEINIRDVATPDPCVGTFKYLDTNYTCLPAIHVVACEGSLAHLFCGQVISVYGADYGRRDETTCSYRRFSFQTRNTLCSGPTNKVAELCNGKNRCTFRVGSSLFGDPCRNTYKYLELAYVCESTPCTSSSATRGALISVQAALYGRADTDTCSEGRPVGQLTNTTCSQPGTEDLVKTRCDGKKECEINIRDVATPDPCVGTFKYLDTNYTCLPASQSTVTLKQPHRL